MGGESKSAPLGRSLLAMAVSVLPLLWLPIALASIGLFGFVVASRFGYPYPLEWLEPATPDIVSRILRGLPIYCAPSYEFVPTMKTPLYYYVVAALSPILGADLAAGRMVSILSTAGTCYFIGRFIRREGGGYIWALFGVSLFLATYDESRQWYDIARLDAFYLLTLVAGAYALRFWRGVRGAAGAGVMFAIAYFAKQTELMVAIPLLCALAFAAPRRAFAAATGFFLPVILGMMLLHLATDGWSTFFLVEVPRYGEFDRGVILSFWSSDLLPPLALAVLIAPGWVAVRWRHDREAALFYGGWLSGALICSWLAKIHVGSTSNALMPIFAVLAVTMPLTLHAALQRQAQGQWWQVAVPPLVNAIALAQLVLLFYDPYRIIPKAIDKRAGDELVSFLTAIDGDVLVMDGRYFATLAGKSTSGLDYAVADLMRVKHSAVPEAFRHSVIEVLHTRKFAGIVDPPDFITGAVELGPPVPIHRQYLPGDDRFRPKAAFFYPIPR